MMKLPTLNLREIVQRWRPSQMLGCDCGSATVKAVSVLRAKERTVLVHHGMQDVDWESAPEQANGQVATFLQTMDVARSNGGLNLSYAGLLLRQAELAKMPERDLRLALRWSFRKDIDGPLENLQVEYTNIAKSAGDRRTLMAYGIEKAVLEQRRTLARALGLRLATLEPTPSALLAAFAHSVPMAPDHCYIVVDVGFDRGTFMVFSSQSVLSARELVGVTLRQLAAGLLPNDVPADAQRAILHALLSGQGALTEAQDNSLREFYRQWLVEVQRGLDTFTSEYKKEGMPGLDRIYVCGGGALLPDITQVAHKNLGVEAVVWDPFSGMVDAAGNAVTVPYAPLYATAVGLALPQH